MPRVREYSFSSGLFQAEHGRRLYLSQTREIDLNCHAAVGHGLGAHLALDQEWITWRQPMPDICWRSGAAASTLGCGLRGSPAESPPIARRSRVWLMLSTLASHVLRGQGKKGVRARHRSYRVRYCHTSALFTDIAKEQHIGISKHRSGRRVPKSHHAAWIAARARSR